MESFDLIVIGSGSGLDVANAAAQAGLKVAIIEKGRMGGTCLNRGCIPSKLLIHSADVVETIRQASVFGVNVENYSIDYTSIVKRVSGIINADSDGIRQAFKGIENPKLFPHEARFVSEKTLTVGDHLVSAKKILIASGTRPSVPAIDGLNEVGYITSDQALNLEIQPKSLTIIGGGFIAAELGHFFGSLGTKINVIQKAKRLVQHEDEEISTKFTELFSSKYNVYLNQDIEKVQMTPNGVFLVTTRDRGEKQEVHFVESDQLLVAAGRIPNSDLLQVEKSGIKTDERGFIVTDQYLETNVKGIFALGDAVGRYLLKHNANHEARYAFHNIVSSFGSNKDQSQKIKVDYSAMPHAIFSSPQIAGVGSTEQELRSAGTSFRKSVYKYMDTAMGLAIEEKEGFVKLLVSDNPETRGKILGCHIIGHEASILIHEIIVAMKAGLKVEQFASIVHIHPALSEVISRAVAQLV